MLDLLKELIFQSGLSSYETHVREYIIRKIKDLATTKVDPIGKLKE